MDLLVDQARQLRLFLTKNWHVLRRNPRSTAVQLFAPAVFSLLLLLLQWQAGRSDTEFLNPGVTPLGGVPQCRPGPLSHGKCMTFAYAPTGNASFEAVTSYAAANNDPPLTKGTLAEWEAASAGSEPQIVGFPTVESMHNFIYSSPNVTQQAIHFTSVTEFLPGSPAENLTILPSLSLGDGEMYVLWNNHTMQAYGFDLRAQARRLFDEAWMVYRAGEEGHTTDITLNIGIRAMPRIASQYADSQEVVRQFGGMAYYSAVMFNFVIVLGQVVTEKEKKLREGMGVMGANDFTFWVSWFVTALLVQAFATVLLILTGKVLGFAIFVSTSFFVSFLLYLVFGISMIQFAFLISTFVARAKTANTVGFVLFIVGFLVYFIVGGPFVYFFFLPEDYLNPLWRRVFMLWPPFNYSKAFADIANLADSKFSVFTGELTPGVGYEWHNLFNGSYREQGGAWDVYCPNATDPNRMDLDDDGNLLPPHSLFSACHLWGRNEGDWISAVPPTSYSIYMLLGNALIFRLISLYVDKVFPGEYGVPLAWHFPLTGPLSWLRTRRHKSVEEQLTSLGAGPDAYPDQLERVVRSLHADPDIADDVVKEEISLLQGKFPPSQLVSILRIRKTFGRFVAVENLSLGFRKNELFALLGHNGAGKSTLISMLTGMIAPSQGDALINGYSVVTQMKEIRRTIGVCPQHDILWDELTAREHLRMFAAFKGVPQRMIEAEVLKKLHDVDLVHVADEPSGSYSGGMKRRLSVAIAGVGDPPVIFLDEPTTGMDPVSRRKVWDLIKSMKNDRVVVLTTHSMEEADMLGDRIAIMATGAIRVIGSSLHLKEAYGTGYRLNLVALDTESNSAVEILMKDALPEAKLESFSAGSFVYSLAAQYRVLVPAFFRRLERASKEELPIKDWGISHSSLEDVFMSITDTHLSADKRIFDGAAKAEEKPRLAVVIPPASPEEMKSVVKG